MSGIPLFLNELSVSSCEMAENECRTMVVRFLDTVRSAKHKRDSIVLVSDMKVSALTFTDSHFSVASLLKGEYQDYWRMLRSLEQSSEPPEGLPEPAVNKEFRVNGETAHGLLYALTASSLSVSFTSSEIWSKSQIEGLLVEGPDSHTEVSVPNLAFPEHVAEHALIVQDFGFEISSSSVIFEASDYDIRMFFNDHTPPHFHVTSKESFPRTIARVAIQTGDTLSGRLSAGVRDQIDSWRAANREALLRNWAKCRNGEHPMRID